MADQISEPASAYALEHTTPLADDLAAVAGWTLHETPTPQMMSGLAEARLLQVLIVAAGAKRVLEIGTFTGFGAMAMAAALPAGGKVTTIEVDPATAESARRHIEASPYAGRIELIVEDALRALERLDGPFDL